MADHLTDIQIAECVSRIKPYPLELVVVPAEQLIAFVREIEAATKPKTALDFFIEDVEAADIRDAERYRWLKERKAYVAVHPHYKDLPLAQRTGWTIRLVNGDESNFDAAIDEAMKGEQP